jgi:integrase
MKLRQIAYGNLLLYRNKRLQTPTHYKRARTIAKMNREVACLRRVFNSALRQNWITRNPTKCCGESLIDILVERRERNLTTDEEKRLLECCTGRRKHLKPLIIFLLSTGVSLGKTIKLKRSDINFENRLITFQALNTKTLSRNEFEFVN